MGEVVEIPQRFYEFSPALQMYDPETNDVYYFVQDADGNWMHDSGEYWIEIEDMPFRWELDDADQDS